MNILVQFIIFLVDKMAVSSSTITTTVTSLAIQGTVATKAGDVKELFGGFKERYDSVTLFRQDLERYGFET